MPTQAKTMIAARKILDLEISMAILSRLRILLFATYETAIMKIMAFFMSEVQDRRLAFLNARPGSPSTILRIRKQKTLAPVKATSKLMATGLSALVRFSHNRDTSS